MENFELFAENNLGIEVIRSRNVTRNSDGGRQYNLDVEYALVGRACDAEVIGSLQQGGLKEGIAVLLEKAPYIQMDDYAIAWICQRDGITWRECYNEYSCLYINLLRARAGEPPVRDFEYPTTPSEWKYRGEIARLLKMA